MSVSYGHHQRPELPHERPPAGAAGSRRKCVIVSIKKEGRNCNVEKSTSKGSAHRAPVVPPPGRLFPWRGRVSVVSGTPRGERRISGVSGEMTPTRVGQQTVPYVTLVSTKN